MSSVEIIPLSKIEELEAEMLKGPSTSVRMEFTFAPGVVVRTAYFPKGMRAIGHEHKTRHINVISKGSFSVLSGTNETLHFKAGDIFVADPGVRKVAEFHEDTVWSNIHPNPDNVQEPEKLEELFITKSATWLAFQQKTLSEAVPSLIE